MSQVMRDKLARGEYSFDELDILEENARRQQNSEFLDLIWESRQLRYSRGERPSSGRRDSIDYHRCGLKNGTVLLHASGEKATVFSHRTLLYQGKEVYITPLSEELSKKYPGVPLNGSWRTEDGEPLSEIYERTYPRTEQLEDRF